MRYWLLNPACEWKAVVSVCSESEDQGEEKSEWASVGDKNHSLEQQHSRGSSRWPKLWPSLLDMPPFPSIVVPAHTVCLRLLGTAATPSLTVPLIRTFSSSCRCLPGTIPGAADHHWHPSLLSGTGCGPEDPPWQHWCVALRVPAPGGHRLLQLYCEFRAGGWHWAGGRGSTLG